MLKRFRWYRKARGGRWRRVAGWLWGTRWIRLEPWTLGRCDEDYTELGSIDNYERFRR